jgi:hypothetical protein
MDNRIIFSNSGTLTDFSVEANDYYNSNANAIPVETTNDYIFIGSRFPFNHVYLKFGTANATASVLSVAVWDGSGFDAVKEVFDETSLAGATFGQDGYVSWISDRSEGWSREDTADSGGTEQVTGLGDLTIYDHYWVRLAVSVNLDAGTTLALAGNRFSDDNDLGAEYPDLVRSNTMTAWDDAGSKTNWEEQHVYAAKEIVKELKERQVLVHKSQILDRKDFTSAAVAKVAEIAFRGMGRDFVDDRIDAKSLFNERINRSVALIDLDQDAQVDRKEIEKINGRLTNI